MALDFLSAPSMGFSFFGYEFRTYRCFVASSVDTERAFSGGHLQVNHLQHQINSQSFKAQVAVGSWYSTLILPSTKPAVGTIHNKTKGKQQATDADDNPMIVIDSEDC